MEKLIRCCLLILSGSLLLKFLAYTVTMFEVMTGPASIFHSPFTAYTLGHTLGMLIRWVAFLGLAKLIWRYKQQRAQATEAW